MSRWGDLQALSPLLPDAESGIAAIEREQITKPRPVSIEGADIYQPGKQEPYQRKLPPECSSVDPITLHTIALIQHAKKVQTLLNGLQHQDRDIKPVEAEYLPAIPEDPSVPGGLWASASCHQGATCERKRPWKPPVQLSTNSVRVILRRVVAAICAHAGFDSELVVSVLVCLPVYIDRSFLILFDFLPVSSNQPRVSVGFCPSHALLLP